VQLVGYGAPSWLTLVDRLDDVQPLHQVLAGEAPGRTSPDQITLFCSVGLAGTEIVLAAEVLRRVRAARTGTPLPTTPEARS
jgi:ornithine cyclodeaminase